MLADYDDWYEENAPCSTGSSRGSRSPSSNTSTLACLAVRWRWTLMWTAFVFVMLVLGFASGCGSRAVFIPDQSPIRVGPGVKGKVWMLVDGQWTLSSNSIEIPEGMYIVPPRFVEEGEE